MKWWLLLLSGCAAAPDAPHAFCAAQANRDPAVRALIVDSVSTPYFHGQDKLAVARASAEQTCLRHQGVLPPGGGVEAPAARNDTVFSW